MAVNRSAKLILSLVDGVSGPARAIQRSLGAVDRAISSVTGGVVRAGRGVLAPSQAIIAGGRHMRSAAASTAGLSAPVGYGAMQAARNVYDYEKEGNTMEAVGQLTEQQREILETYGKELNSSFPFINKQILEAASELGKAGMNFDQIMGSLRSTLETALAGDMPLKETADIMTNVAQAMRLPMETAEEAAVTMERVSDTLAHAAVNSNADINQMAVTFRYVAPLAAAVGMSLEEMAVFSMELANNGIKASNAGTGLRFALNRMLNMPKAGLAALERLNINLGDFVKGAQAIDATGVVSMLQLDGIDATGLETQIQSILDDPAIRKSPAKLVKSLSAMMTDALGEEGIVDAKILSDSLSEVLTVLGTDVDFRGFLKAIGDRPEGEALMGQIFGARHSSKMLALLAANMDREIETFEDRYKGAARRMSEIRIKGVVGDWLRLQAALDNLTLTLSDSGVLESARKLIVAFSDMVTAVSEVNPALLEMGTYGVLGLAAIAPLAWGAAGLAGALGLLVNPLTWVTAGLGYIAYLNFDNIVSYVKGFGSAVQDNMGPRTAKLIDGLSQSLGRFFSSADDWDARAAGGAHGAAFAAGIEEMISTVEVGVDRVKSALSGMAASDSGRAFADLLIDVKETVSELAATSWDRASARLSSLATSFEDFGGRLGTAFTGNGVKAVEMLQSMFRTTAEYGAAAGRGLQAVADSGASFLDSFLKNIDTDTLNTMGAGFDSFFSLVTRGANALSEVMGRFQPDVEGMKNAASQLGKLAADGLDSLVSLPGRIAELAPRLLDSGSQAIQGLIDGMKAKVGEMLEWVKSIPSKIGEAIGEIRLSDFISWEMPEVDWKGFLFGKAAEPGFDFREHMRSGVGVASTPEAFTGPSDASFAEAEQKQLALAEATKQWPWAAQQAIREYTDALRAGGTAAEGEATRIGAGIKEQLSVVAHPDVNTGRLERALGLARQLASALRNMPSGTASSSTSAKVSFDGARARGGPVRRGRTYLVGENGPEPFTPDSNGYVHPNGVLSQLASGTGGGRNAPITVSPTINMTINGANGNVEALADKVARKVVKETMGALDSALNRSSQVVFGGLKPYGDA